MKISLKSKIDFTQVDSDFVLTLPSLVKLFQQASIKHLNKLGIESKQQIKDGVVWVLYQFGIEVGKWPLYEEDIEIITWHRGTNGYKAYREFEVYSGKEKIANASSAYLYYNIKDQKIMRLPRDVNTIYSAVDELAFKENLELWKTVPRVDHEFETIVSTRLSDFDPLGHVNNSVYYDYVETMLFSYLNREKKIKKIKIQYAKEIKKSIRVFRSGILKDDNNYKFKLFDENKIFAFGEIDN